MGFSFEKIDPAEVTVQVVSPAAGSSPNQHTIPERRSSWAEVALSATRALLRERTPKPLRHRSADPYLDGANLRDPMVLFKALQRAQILEYILNNKGTWFGDQESCDEVYTASKTFATYIRDNAVADVVFLDRGARTIRVGISEYWALAFPDTRAPDMHFLNPKIAVRGFGTHNRFTGSRMYTKIERQLRDSRSSLLDKKDKPVLLVDGCLHTGTSLAAVKYALETVGFQDVRVGVFDRNNASKALIVNDVSPGQSPDTNCYPFGLDLGIRNDGSSIYTTPLEDPVSHLVDSAVRANLRQVIRQEFAAEQQTLQ